jgi:predicted PurR-regulated permease PerM/CheY-like chemotaxis protein
VILEQKIPLAGPRGGAKSSLLLTLASFVVLVAALYLAKGVLIPLTLAVLLTFLLSPVCDRLERWKLSRIPAVLVTAILGFTLLGAAAWTSTVQMSYLVPKIPEYEKNLEAKLGAVNDYAVGVLRKVTRTGQRMDQGLSSAAQPDEPRGTDELPFSVRVLSSPTSPLRVFGGMFGTLLEVSGTAGIVIVLVVFFLLRREDMRDRFIHLVGRGHVTVTTQMLEDAGARISHYLSTLFLLNVVFGITVGIALYLIGVPSAILWGILAALLRFIPYIGPWIAAAMPIGLAMAISTGWGAPLLTVGVFVVLELFSNNVLEPWLYSKQTGVSAVAVLVAAVFWMWLWGPVGLLLATPLTVCLLVVGRHVPQLSFLDILLGNDPVFEPQKRIYQRLLAGDAEEAAELLDDYFDQRAPVEVYDSVLIPALALAETHWRLGDLNDSKHTFIMQSLREMIQDRAERQQERQASQRPNPTPRTDEDTSVRDPGHSRGARILCLPARSEADEIASLLLAQVLEASGHVVQTASVASSTSGIDLVEQHKFDLVCISATPPAAVMHSRYLCKRLRGGFPELSLVVGLWDAQGSLSKATERIGCAATVVATLADAREHIHRATSLPLPQSDRQAERGYEPVAAVV